MEKEKQIEEMAKVLCSLIKDGIRKDCEKCYFKHDGYRHTCKFRKRAIKLYKAGYGNVKEAVKEAEHRAEVAERALKDCSKRLSVFTKSFGDGATEEEVYNKMIKIAEKELSEEQI